MTTVDRGTASEWRQGGRAHLSRREFIAAAAAGVTGVRAAMFAAVPSGFSTSTSIFTRTARWRSFWHTSVSVESRSP